ncbi:polymorphic toxin type 24 domain-containing protein [Fibrella aquatilis]|uniref:Bacterial toxin 24 domain-containing protein n=1 Tax=Fibrella aquatilis TaxID=2817059 RepID=A0A939JX44_9BACT|nr:polymorphic toxin type 24 domain-containing protein [Fibrella aquatilis]MBO0930654.1 hypothetical protein [Fibrella aquatilis]
MLVVTAGSWQHRWVTIPPGWHRPIVIRPQLMPTAKAAPVVKSVAQMSHTERLEEAILRSIHRFPNHLANVAKELFTPANIITFVGLTVALMASGVGEVLGLGLLVFGAVVGGLDLCIDVLRMLVDFYHKAINAQTDPELDEAADLFAAAVTRGGFDIIDIVIGRRAAGKLAGRGLRGVGEYFAYLEREMKLWRGRQVNNGASSQRMTAPAKAPPKLKPAAKAENPASTTTQTSQGNKPNTPPQPKSGKGKNKLEPNKDAQGDHTVYERDQNGNVYKYETYEKTSSGHYNPKGRYDGGKPDGTPGAPHVNKQTKKPIPTPHMQGKHIPGGVRPAEPAEIPKINPKLK